LVGAPPGYVGYDEGGALTEAIRRRPYQVILFDEVEKAHEDVFNILLQVLDDGRLTDGQGRTVDFRNTIIVLTSNLGSQAIAELPETADIEAARPAVMRAVRDRFRPEFLNRLDEIVLFRRLARSDMASIVDIQLGGLRKLLEDRKIHLELDAAAREWLAEAGYDPAYGARPLKRVIQRNLQDKLANLLLEGSIHDGEQLQVTAGPDGLEYGGRTRRVWPRQREARNAVTMSKGEGGVHRRLLVRRKDRARFRCRQWCRPDGTAASQVGGPSPAIGAIHGFFSRHGTHHGRR
jgi:ATP-dependent Clp protease ATP-binding subunit ClpB